MWRDTLGRRRMVFWPPLGPIGPRPVPPSPSSPQSRPDHHLLEVSTMSRDRCPPCPELTHPSDTWVEQESFQLPGRASWVLHTMAVGIRAAIRPATRTPRATRTTDKTGTVGLGTPLMFSANSVHSWCPMTIPTATPTMPPTTAVIVDCHATTAAICRAVTPRALNRARSHGGTGLMPPGRARGRRSPLGRTLQ